jgi:hypothetical protein
MQRAAEHTLIEYQSLRVKGSTVFFLRPFLPFESLLFLWFQAISRLHIFDRDRCLVGGVLTFQPP